MSSFKITKVDDRFFSRLMAKEKTTSTSTRTPNSSSRIFYYGETSVAVPFTWEAQPGTPKHPLSETSLPPLTPPPSYFSSRKSHNIAKRSRNYLSKAANNMFSSILPWLGGSRKPHDPHHHVSPSSHNSSSFCSSRSLAYYSTSPTSFSRPSKHKCSGGFRGCYPFANIRNVANVSHASVD